MESRLSEYVTLTFSFEQEESAWVGTCLELGTSTFADTLEECQAELEELVTDHLDVLEEVGERERFFKEWGIDVHTDAVPGEFTIGGSGDSWNRLFKESSGFGGPFLRPRVFPAHRSITMGIVKTKTTTTTKRPSESYKKTFGTPLTEQRGL